MNNILIPGSRPADSRQTQGYLRFIQTAIGVLLALLVVDVADSLAQAVSAGQFVAQTVLLVVLVFVLVELFVVLSDLHAKLKLPYAPPWLYMDLLVGLVFFWFTVSISASGTCRLVEAPNAHRTSGRLCG